MALIVAGVSHHTAPVGIRERLVLGQAAAAQLAGELRSTADVAEAVVVSTCNRTEFYAVEQGVSAAPVILDLMSERLGAGVSPHAYVKRDREAVTHLYGVAAGLDSMIFGESQIQGQVREAWDRGRADAGPILNKLFQTALACATRVREETSVARGAGSVSSAAVQLARKIFGSLRGRRAMVLGAGEVAELALACLADDGVKVAIVANRTFARAEALAARHGARALHFDECWRELVDVDVLVCSTASPRPVVEVSDVEAAVSRRGDRPLCILDIALPRDVDREVGRLDNVFLYDLDDLQAAAAATLERRRSELPAAHAIIEDEAERYWKWHSALAAVPVVAAMRREMERVREAELAAALRRNGPLPEGQRAAMDELSRSLLNKFLHGPTTRLREAAGNGRGIGIVEAARYLFGVEENAPDSGREPPDHQSS